MYIEDDAVKLKRIQEMFKEYEPKITLPPITTSLNKQVDGTHYKDVAIQPIEYIIANNLGFIEGNIIKYVTRWKKKDGIKDIEKVIHYAEMLKEYAQRELAAAHTLGE